MRLIVRNRPSLHIWNVNDYIKQTQANIIKQDSNKYITLQKIFRKIYLRHLNDHQKIKHLQNDLDNFVLMSTSPARTITDFFHQKSKSYSEPFLRITFQALARAHQISKYDNNGSLDTLGYKLFYSSEFSNLSEQLKYAIRNNKIQFDSIVSIIDSLVKLEYVDYEIINLLILYTKRQINGSDPYALLKDWEGDREFQIEKKDYYNPKELDQLASLRNSEEVNTAVSFVKHIYQQWQKNKAIIETLKQHNIKEMNQLVEEVIHTSQNFRKLVQGIINVRRQYQKMVQFSQNEQVLRNPNLNFQLLEVEEKLLATKLLTIEDIKNPKAILNAKDEVKQIQQIILRVLNVERLDPIFAIVDKSQIEVINQNQTSKPNPAKISKLLNGLAKLAEIDRYVYHAADGKNLVSLKWEKTLLNPQGSRIPTNFDEQLNVSRIYRRVYKEIYQFVSKYGNKLDSTFKNSNLNDKIQLLDAYCRLGLNQYTVNYINVVDTTFQNSIHKLNQENFDSLLHVLNNVGIFIRNQSFHSTIFDRIAESLLKQEANTIHKNIRFTIDIVNYLLQNHRNKENFRPIYQRELNLLQTKATYVTLEGKQAQNIVEAFKILALQRPHKFGSHPIYLSYLYRSVNDQYKRNPYHSILRQAVFKWANKHGSLKQMQNYLTIGVNNGIKNGIVFSNSDETSLDGTIRNGDLNSYIVRLQLKDGVKINELPINQYIDINYSENTKIFSLKSFSELKRNLNQLFQYKDQEFDHIYLQLQSNLVEIIKYYQPCLISDRIKFKLVVINKLRLHSTNIQTKQQQFSNKAKFLLEILELSKLINLLNQKNILETIPRPQPTNVAINDKLERQKFEPQEKDVIEVDVDTIKMLLKEVRNIIPDLLDSLTKFMSKQTLSLQNNTKQQNVQLKGQRQSIQVIDSQPIDKLDLTYQIINLRYYNDKSYCQYKDWQQKISKKYHYVQLPIENMSNLTKILANKLCGNLTNKLNLLPVCKHEDRIQRLALEFKVFQHQNLPKASVPQTKTVDRQLEYIINLQTFKHELKNYYSPQKLIEYIFGFKFIHDLNKRSSQKQKLVLTRNPQEYFNYLQELNDKSYLESAYAKYIISKLGRTDKIRILLEQRKILRINLRISYQKGLINGSQYYEKINEFEDQIISALDELKTKMLDHMQDTLLGGQFKMLNIKKEELQAFQDIINKQIAYSRHFDQDFICSNGNYQRAIHLKRGRAQNNYIKFYLLKKVSENQILDHRQKHLLKKWHEDIIKNVSQFVVYNEYTTLQIGDLSWQDLQQLKLKNSQLNINKDMLLIDLILEFNQFLDEDFIFNYQRQVKSEYISKHFHIPSYLFDKTNNGSFKRLQVETEAAIVNEHSKLTQKDLNKVEELFQIYKTQGFKQRNRYQIFCKHFKDNITQMNDQIIRNQLMEEYIKHLQAQFYKEYDPSLVSQIKERQTDKLWRSVFQLTYDGSSKELLKEITKKIIIRLEVIGENAPPFFGLMLLKLLLHPNIDYHSRESLIAAIQINHFDLNLDSADIQAISKLSGRSIRSSQQTRNELKAISRVKINKFLRQKIKTAL